jgi:hypothetical protein
MYLVEPRNLNSGDTVAITYEPSETGVYKTVVGIWVESSWSQWDAGTNVLYIELKEGHTLVRDIVSGDNTLDKEFWDEYMANIDEDELDGVTFYLIEPTGYLTIIPIFED